jgi:uncharacterized protein with FMN-binding domain
MMLNAYEQHSKRKLIATILSIVVIAGSVVVADHIKNATPTADSTQTAATTDTTTSPGTSSTTDTTTPTTTDNSSSSTSSSSYKDGTYSASSSYFVPHGNESIEVDLTLKDGVITTASIQNSEGDHESAAYQEDFASAYKSFVVGKKISDLQLGVIAGASDTTQGFEDALSQIASKAQA